MKLLIMYFLLFFTILSAYPKPLEGVTRPSADVAASFTGSGLIIEVNVKEGSAVKANQALARLSSEAEERELQRLRKEAQGDIKQKRAKSEIVYYKKQLKLLVEAHSKGAASDREVDEAHLSLTTAELNLKEAIFDSEVLLLKAKELESRLKDFRLKSPIDGIIEKISIEEGEPSHPNEEHIRIVRIDPLWVEVAVPLGQIKDYKNAKWATVQFSDGSKKGKLIFISPIADTASDTVRIRLEVANPENRLAGERVKIAFPTKK